MSQKHLRHEGVTGEGMGAGIKQQQVQHVQLLGEGARLAKDISDDTKLCALLVGDKIEHLAKECFEHGGPLFALPWTIAVRAETSLSASMFRLRQLLYWQVAELRWLSTAIASFLLSQAQLMC